jgi:hypothetical protein
MLCGPEGLSFSAMAKIVVEYIDAHPEMRDKGFSEVACAALMLTWPCKK